MIRTSPGWQVTLAVAFCLFLAGVPSFAATGPADGSSRSAQYQKLCSGSVGSVYHLATMDNALDGSFQCLGLSLERGTVVAIRLETHHFAASGRQADSANVSIDEFPLSVVESSHGAVLDGVPGHDAIILRGLFPKSPDRVELVTSYLYNGFTNEYRSCLITLDRGPNGGWRLLNRFNQTISHIAIRTREMPVIGPFGIAELEGACTPHDR
jgi:hypothetical protein